MDKLHDVGAITFDGDTMVLPVDGGEIRVDLAQCSERLLSASPSQRENYVISPSGYGVHWPDVDEDLSIDGLLGVRHASPILEAAV